MMNIVMACPFKVGDALLTFPVLEVLRAKYMNVHITFVGNPSVLPLAKEWRIAEEVREYDKHWSLLFSDEPVRRSKLRKLLQQTDLVLAWPTMSAIMLKQNLHEAGAKKVIIFKPPDDPNTHVIEHISELAAVPVVRADEVVLPYTGPNFIRMYNSPVALHPGCMEYRRWPAASYASLIDALLRLRYPVLLLGGPMEADLLKTVLLQVTEDEVAQEKGMLTVLNNAPLVQVAQQLKQCGCYVGHDTGTSHLAGLLGIPTLVLFGPSNPAMWRPVGPTVQVIQHEPLSALSVDAVLEHIQHVYQTSVKQGPSAREVREAL